MKLKETLKRYRAPIVAAFALAVFMVAVPSLAHKIASSLPLSGVRGD